MRQRGAGLVAALYAVALRYGSAAPCGNTLVWLEKPVTQRILDVAVANLAALEPESLTLAVYCSLWGDGAYGGSGSVMASADILAALSGNGTRPVKFLARMDDTSTEGCPADVIGRAMDSEDPAESSAAKALDSVATLACASSPNTWKNGSWSNCCPSGASLDSSKRAACDEPIGQQVSEFYDFGIKPYSSVAYVQSYLGDHFSDHFAASMVPMFRPDPDHLHDGWMAPDSAQWRAQDSHCTAFPTVGLYVSDGE
jgi:hypothetical protein